MSEEFIIKHCSPTLAGLKTANLFTCTYRSKQSVMSAVRRFNRAFGSKGVIIMPLKFGKNRVLIYLFRPAKLARDLSDERARAILYSLGYDCADMGYCISNLKRRIDTESEFPHEIGLFLGYPPEDVQGFILHKGNCCKCCGCWKVYSNEEQALRAFAVYKKCSDIYYSKWLSGTSIEKLIVSKKSA